MNWIEHRRNRLQNWVVEFQSIRFCSPFDEPEGHYYMSLHIRQLAHLLKVVSKSIVPSDLKEEIDSIFLDIDPNDSNSVDLLHGQLQALVPDIDYVLSAPLDAIDFSWTGSSFTSSSTLEKLLAIKPTQFNISKLNNLLKELNNVYYHGNYAATILIVRTVLNIIPPIFGHETFSSVASQSPKSYKSNFEYLEKVVRELGNVIAHDRMDSNSKENYLTIQQVEPIKPPFETLLQETYEKLKIKKISRTDL